ncbi:AraC family transcriptional regulator [Aeromonas cavernicola]|uniref:AraC effector-binding domain-containing protein n=1 Tax=Aeromonas cavernicola TaxID=1006623 RepID=A0A2H9U3S6_9GAMM|nr:GyrI-like domain-containing protein [Aeromonas cavernicola]PJG58692.1 hypothetical protein CUC53_11015 [Aeromonas cavernicola]
MKIERMAPRTLAYIRVTGPYGKDYQTVCDRLEQWATTQGLVGVEFIFIYHDNPETTPPPQCRTDICVTVPTDAKGSGGVSIQQFVGGRYGSSRFTVTDPAQYPQLWRQHISDVIHAGYSLLQAPCFEHYHRYDPLTQVADVSFCCRLTD